MQMVLIDDMTLRPKKIDIEPSECVDMLKEMMPEMDFPGFITRNIEGTYYVLIHDDEFLYHGRNFTGIATNSREIIQGSFIVCKEQPFDPNADVINDLGLLGLTDEECDTILNAWKPVSPELAQAYAKDLRCPDLVFMMGSNALQYKV